MTTATLADAWARLARHRERLASTPPASRFESGPQRYAELRRQAAGITLDVSRTPLDDALFEDLIALLNAADFDAARAKLFRLNRLNPTEGRPVLHTALRTPSGDPETDASVRNALARMRTLTARIRSGAWRGATGKPIDTLVHVGLGGSVLGPRVVCEALDRGRRGPAVHFVDNVDGHALAPILREIDAERTLFVIASKSFTTMETLEIGLTVRRWYVERGIAGADFARHCVAVTANTDRAAAFGLDASNCLPMWDWVGGRYSVWSAIGLPIAVHLGWDVFEALLTGAREMDAHFRTASVRQNVPVLMALAALVQRNLLDQPASAVLAYDSRLGQLLTYLQQLDMESNGKQVRLDGSPVAQATAPIIWGGVGTSCQHAFMQAVHQGTVESAVEFILVRRPDHDLTHHHRWLLAHGVSQAEALLAGRLPAAEDPLASHRAVPGGRASTMLLLDALTPATLGALLAAYEHKIFVQGLVWDVNSFDQWGVEIGKLLGDEVRRELDGEADPPPTREIVRELRAD